MNQEIMADPVVTLGSLEELDDEKFINKHIICQVTVLRVEDYPWHYNVCSSCDEEVEFTDGEYWCEKCQTSISSPCGRYRLCLIAEDFSSCAAIFINNREIQSIIKKNASEIYLEQQKEGKQGQFPNILKNFEGNQYTIRLRLSERNIKHDSDLYFATDICEISEMGGDSTRKDEKYSSGYRNSQMMLHSPNRESSTNKEIIGNNNSQIVYEDEYAGNEDEDNTTPE